MTTYYVSPTGNDINPGTEPLPFRNIQKAADKVNPGDTVIVKDGSYTDANGDGRIVNFTTSGTSDKWITFKSENRWGAVLDGQGDISKYGFLVSDSASYIRFEGLQFKGMGFTIFARTWTPNPPHKNIIMKGNYMHDCGGAMYCENVDNVVIDSNFVHDISMPYADDDWMNKDHAVYAADYSWEGIPRGTCNKVTIINNIFHNCSGVSLTMGGTNYLVSNNTLAWSNFNSSGGSSLLAFSSRTKNMIIQNNILYQPPSSNDGTPAMWFYYGGAEPDYDYSSITIRNNIVYEATMFGNGFGNVPVAYRPKLQNNYCDRDCEKAGINPLFIGVSKDKPALENDWHLQSTSPCIGKGLQLPEVAYDFDGNPRTGRNDIGALQYVEGCPSLITDFRVQKVT